MAPSGSFDDWSPSGGAKEEPLSLRRLRESLSSLERLERQRGELRGRAAAESQWRSSSEGASFSMPPSCSPTLLGGLGHESDKHRSSEGLAMRGLHFASGRVGDEYPPSPPRLASSSSPRGSPPTRPRGGAMPSACAAAQDRERESSLHRDPPPGRDRIDSTLFRERDSALAGALERAQDRIDQLQQERDEALRQVAAHESEVVRLTVQLERSEGEHRSLAEERQRELAEISRLRREHRETLEQVAALRAEAHQSRTTSEEWRVRFDKLVADQRQQIASLEDAGSRASRDLVEHESRAQEFGDGLYTCIHERTALLHFVVDLIAALQSLFYDPTPFILVEPNAGRRTGSGARARSMSAPHRHNGCSACSRPSSGYGARSPSYGAKHSEGRQDWRDGLVELQELIASLENEIGETSEKYTAQVHRVVDEAEQCARLIRTAETDSIMVDRPGERGVYRTCAAWCEQEHRRLEQLGLPPDCLAPRIDWAEERAQYHAVTRQMESKFAQLMKLKRVLQARQQVLKKRGCA